MSQKENLEKILNSASLKSSLDEKVIRQEIDKVDFDKFSYSDVENLISKLDDNKKKQLIDILNTIK